MESDKIVPKIRLSPNFGSCTGGNSENGAGNIFPRTTKNAVWGAQQYANFVPLMNCKINLLQFKISTAVKKWKRISCHLLTPTVAKI